MNKRNPLVEGFYVELERLKGFSHFVEVIKIPAWQESDWRVKNRITELSESSAKFFMGDFYYYPIIAAKYRTSCAPGLLHFPPTHRIQVGFFKGYSRRGANDKVLLFELTVSLDEIAEHTNFANEIGNFLMMRLSQCSTRFGLAPSRENSEWLLLCFLTVYSRLRRELSCAQLG